MQLKRRTATAVLTLMLLAAPALAADLAGEWLLTMDGKSPSGEKEATLTFAATADGEPAGELKVTMSGKSGSVESPGKLADGEVSWLYTSPKKGVQATYQGRVRGSLMGGTVDVKGKPVAWQARRVGDDVFDLAGTWTFFIKGEARDYANLTKMTFAQDGPDLVVTMASEAMEVECRGTLDGVALSFDYVRATQDGGEYTAKMTGSVSGALMGGDADLGEYGRTTWNATRDTE